MVAAAGAGSSEVNALTKKIGADRPETRGAESWTTGDRLESLDVDLTLAASPRFLRVFFFFPVGFLFLLCTVY